jgi:hypothetical protein
VKHGPFDRVEIYAIDPDNGKKVGPFTPLARQADKFRAELRSAGFFPIVGEEA